MTEREMPTTMPFDTAHTDEKPDQAISGPSHIAGARAHDRATQPSGMAASQPSEHLLGAVVTNAPVLLFALDGDGVFTLFHGKELDALACRTDAIVGRSALELLRGYPEILGHVERALGGESFTSIDVLEHLVFETRWMPTTRAGGQLGGAVGVATNVTERVRAEESLAAALLRELEEAQAQEAILRRANQRLDEFLGVAGHEMRTPLTALSGNFQLLRRRLTPLVGPEDASILGSLPDSEGLRRLLDRTDVALRRLCRVVDDVLDISRIQSGRLLVQPEPCDLAALVREVVADICQIEPRRTIRLACDHAGVAVVADSERIGQVVANYLSNALKYSLSHEPVTVGLDATDTDATVWVRDRGIGIRPEDVDKVWERFYRAADAAPQHGSSVGLGLGLYISRSIVERHGGHVGATSTQGEGSTFWLRLPRVATYA